MTVGDGGIMGSTQRIEGLTWWRDEPSPPAPLGRRAARPSAAEGAEAWLAARSEGPMAPGSVLLHAPSWTFQAPGGGENQLVQTGRALEALGRPVRPFAMWRDRLPEARALHLFGMSREGLELARVARARRVPVVLSPICWFEARALSALAVGFRSRVIDVGKHALRRAWPTAPGWRRSLLGLADAILPNSRAEGEQLARLFGADRGKVTVVPNGVDPRFAQADPSAHREAHGHGDFVLYVGRIEPRKNVLGLIRGARWARLPLVIVGDPVPGHEAYAAACRREADASTLWLPRMDHDDPRLASAYAACRVFALPSWFETPGLAALEAGLAGRPVVVTPLGCTREYFGAMARYARPDRPLEIGRALAEAWEDGPDPGLAPHIRGHYLWADAARATAEVYDRL